MTCMSYEEEDTCVYEQRKGEIIRYIYRERETKTIVL